MRHVTISALPWVRDRSPPASCSRSASECVVEREHCFAGGRQRVARNGTFPRGESKGFTACAVSQQRADRFRQRDVVARIDGDSGAASVDQTALAPELVTIGGTSNAIASAVAIPNPSFGSGLT